MAAPKGNQFWKNIPYENIGRKRNFPEPKDLWEETQKYFEECDKNPFESEETTSTDKGKYSKKTKHKIPYTWEGLYVFLLVCNLDRYREKKEFVGIITHIGNIIRNQKFSGAASGLFNANLIARELGIKESVDINQTTRKAADELFPNEEELNG